jgi:hypothetical protein
VLQWTIGGRTGVRPQGGLQLWERWACWRIVPSPNPTITENSQLDAVAALTPHDVWAVGFHRVNLMPRTLTEHRS